MTRKQRKLYPSQVRKGDVLTLHDHAHPDGRCRTYKVTATGDAYEAGRGHFTGERRVAVPVERSHSTLWRTELEYVAKRRIEVERPTDG